MKYYVCDYRTHRVLLGPWTSAQVVEFINNSSDPKLYCNMSRYMLAKEGVYPNNKAGDNLIAFHLVSGLTPRAADDGGVSPDDVPFGGWEPNEADLSDYPHRR